MTDIKNICQLTSKVLSLLRMSRYELLREVALCMNTVSTAPDLKALVTITNSM